MPLHEFLEIPKIKERLSHNCRAFYIVEALMDKGQVIKFGVAGISGGRAFSRLRDYDIMYGRKAKQNDCKGVIVHYVGVTEYNSQVETKNSLVWKLEHHFKTTRGSVTVRGSERVPKSHLKDMLEYISNSQFRDVATPQRVGMRQTTQTKRTKDTSSHKQPVTGGMITRNRTKI